MTFLPIVRRELTVASRRGAVQVSGALHVDAAIGGTGAGGDDEWTVAELVTAIEKAL